MAARPSIPGLPRQFRPPVVPPAAVGAAHRVSASVAGGGRPAPPVGARSIPRGGFDAVPMQFRRPDARRIAGFAGLEGVSRVGDGNHPGDSKPLVGGDFPWVAGTCGCGDTDVCSMGGMYGGERRRQIQRRFFEVHGRLPTVLEMVGWADGGSNCYGCADATLKGFMTDAKARGSALPPGTGLQGRQCGGPDLTGMAKQAYEDGKKAYETGKAAADAATGGGSAPPPPPAPPPGQSNTGARMTAAGDRARVLGLAAGIAPVDVSVKIVNAARACAMNTPSMTPEQCAQKAVNDYLAAGGTAGNCPSKGCTGNARIDAGNWVSDLGRALSADARLGATARARQCATASGAPTAETCARRAVDEVTAAIAAGKTVTSSGDFVDASGTVVSAGGGSLKFAALAVAAVVIGKVLRIF